MKNLFMKILLCAVGYMCFTVLVYGAEHSLRPMTYQSALLEYYSAYGASINDKEIEESYILLYPRDYEANEENEAKRKQDLEKVKAVLNKSVSETNSGTHEYSLMFESQLGAYDKESGGFACVLVSSHNFMDFGPINNGTKLSGDKAQEESVIAKALLFNKVNRIKLFFSNTDQFNFLKYPADKAAQLLKNQKNAGEPQGVFTVLNIVIMPGTDAATRQKLNDTLKGMFVQGEESSYFMLAKIKSIEVYDNFTMQKKLGNVEYRGHSLKTQ